MNKREDTTEAKNSNDANNTKDSTKPNQDVVARAVVRVAHALQRAKYFVAIDSLQTYDSQILTHDGTSHISSLTTKRRYQELREFLEDLAGVSLGESHIGMSVDNPWPRHEIILEDAGEKSGDPSQEQDLEEDNPSPIVRKLQNQVTDTVAALATHFHKIEMQSQKIDPHPTLQKLFPQKVEINWSWDKLTCQLVSPGEWYNHRLWPTEGGEVTSRGRYALVFLLLTAVRRTRTHAGLRWLLEPVCGQDGRTIDEFVNFISRPEAELGILRLEGGGCWYDRRIRDYIYHKNTKFAGTKELCELFYSFVHKSTFTKLETKYTTPIRNTVFQLFANVTAHQLASRGYYSRAYLPSGDTFNFLEYLYHRVSCIRYLCKLVALVRKISEVSGARRKKALREVRMGLASFGIFIQASTNDGGAVFFDRIRMSTDEDDTSTADSTGKKVSKSSEQLLMAILKNKDCIRCDDVLPENFSEKLLTALTDRHQNEVEGLIRSWELAEAELRTKLPAEQLLQLCEHMLEDEFRFRLNSVTVGYNLTDTDENDFKEKMKLISGDPETYKTTSTDQPKTTNNGESSKSSLNVYLLHFEGNSATVKPTTVNDKVYDILKKFELRIRVFRERVTLDRTDYKAVLTYMSESDDNESIDVRARMVVIVILGKYLDAANKYPLPKIQSAKVVRLREPSKIDELKSDGSPDKHREATDVVHRVLDLIVCLMKIYQHKLSNIDLESFMVRVDKQLQELQLSVEDMEKKHKLPEATKGPYLAKLFDARMRIMNLRTEAAFGRTSVFANCGFDGSAQKMIEMYEKANDHESAKADDPFPQPLTENPQRAEEVLLILRAQIRYTPPHRVHEPRSMIVDPTPGGVLYEPYRSITHMYAGKLNWLQCYKGDGGAFRRAKFESAFRDFDLARSALGDSNPLIRTLVELHSVECCLAYSRIVLHPGFNADQLEVQPAMLPAMVESKLETARTSLKRAQNYLGRYRRNVLWWRGYYHLVAQYHAERILCGLAEMLFHANPEADPHLSDEDRGQRQKSRLRLLGTRLRRAYAGLRTLFDYNLKDELRDQSAWSIRAWYEMTLAVYAAAASVAHESHNPNIHDYVVRQLQWLNLCAGLHHAGVQNAKRNTLERPSQNLWQLVTDHNLKYYEEKVRQVVTKDGVKNDLQVPPLLRRQAVILATGDAVNKLFREIRNHDR